MVSFKIGKSDSSYATFGDYNMKYVKAEKSITWNPLVEYSSWILDLKQMRVGNQKLITMQSLAVIDTGTSFLGAPSIDFERLIKLITKG